MSSHLNWVLAGSETDPCCCEPPVCGPDVFGETITLTVSGIETCPCGEVTGGDEMQNVTLPAVWSLVWDGMGSWTAAPAGVADLYSGDCETMELAAEGEFVASAFCETETEIRVSIVWTGPHPLSGLTVYSALFTELTESQPNETPCGFGNLFGGGNGSI